MEPYYWGKSKYKDKKTNLVFTNSCANKLAPLPSLPWAYEQENQRLFNFTVAYFTFILYLDYSSLLEQEIL